MLTLEHDAVIKWKHFPRYWPFVRGIHRSPVNSPHKGQWRGALIFSLIYVWINDWENNREAGDLKRYRAHCDVTVMSLMLTLEYRLMVLMFCMKLTVGIVRDSKIHGVNMGPTWVLSAQDGPHVGPMNLATRGVMHDWFISIIPYFNSDNGLYVPNLCWPWRAFCMVLSLFIQQNPSKIIQTLRKLSILMTESPKWVLWGCSRVNSQAVPVFL